MDINHWKDLKKQQKLTFDALSEKSKIPKRTLEDIFAGRTTDPRATTVEAVELALGIYTSPRLENDPVIFDEVELDEDSIIPLLGRVAAGVPIESQENIEGYIYVNYRPKSEYFAVRVHGDSMINAGIPDNGILVVHKQARAESGEIVVAMLNKEQTVKRFKIIGKQLFLMPENPAYDPIPITESDELIILGKVVEVRFSL